MGFRVDRQKFGFTWSCPIDKADNPIESCEELLDALTFIFGDIEYTIGEELHENGKRHYHAWVKCAKSFETTNVHKFDIKGVHPNIINPGKGWESYCVKHAKYITNHYKECNFLVASKKRTWVEASEYLWEHEPKYMMTYGSQAERNFNCKRRKQFKVTIYYGPYPEDWYDMFDKWDKRKSMNWIGDPGCGKTQWIHYYLKHLGLTYFRVKGSLAGLKHWNGEQVLLFDDLEPRDDFKDWNSLLDVEQGGSIDCKGYTGVVEIPGGIKRIFIHNGQFQPPDIYGSLKRRMECWETRGGVTTLLELD